MNRAAPLIAPIVLALSAVTTPWSDARGNPFVTPRPLPPPPLVLDDEPPAARTAQVEVVSAPLPGLTPAPRPVDPALLPLLEWRWVPGDVHRFRREVDSAMVFEGQPRARGRRVRETQVVVDHVDETGARLLFTTVAYRSEVVAGGQAVTVDSDASAPVPAAASLGATWDLALLGTPIELFVGPNGAVRRVEVPDGFAAAERALAAIRMQQGHPGGLDAIGPRLATLRAQVLAPENWRLQLPALPGGRATPGRRWTTRHGRDSALIGRVAQVLEHVVESVRPGAVVIAFTDRGVVAPNDDAEHVERFRNPGRLTFDPVRGVVTDVMVQLDSATRVMRPDGSSRQRHVWMTISQIRLDEAAE